MRSEWKDRIKHWVNILGKELYEPLGEIRLEGLCTYDQLSEEQAEAGVYSPMPEGTPWGRNWEYCWMRGDITLDERCRGQYIVMDLNPGGEAALFVDGEAFGTRRADWVRVPHHNYCDQVLTCSGEPGRTYHLLMEVYAGHTLPSNAIGPYRGEADDYHPLPDDAIRTAVGHSTWGIWHETAYQLWMDVRTLQSLLEAIDKDSLRAAKVEEALERFTMVVDLEQPRAARLADYARARELLAPVLACVNGSTVPHFSAIGNAHLDLSWLWSYGETQRKVARTFAQQARLMDLYPEYRFLQSQPDSYRICKENYPALYARIKEKIKARQWVADGSMWVEPDTNMPSGEALVRQLVHGKRFYKEEFGIDTQMLWLPDTFGYSAVLPQLLKSAGVKYLTTQKIFWTYNDSDKFPYHYFTWQGMDGTEITSFLHMDYCSHTDPATLAGHWRNRVQKRDLTNFLLPFGYGDGGGGPTRDDIEYIRRGKNLEGAPSITMEAPQHFFETCAKGGAPVNKYVGELYFQCHRGTYTSQAAVKRGNRKSELALRDAELWSVIAMDKVPYPLAQLDKAWKNVLLNQFHDILPGSSIARVYQEAAARYAQVRATADDAASNALSALTAGEGRTYFNSLSWPRREIVKTDAGYGMVTLPAMGWTSTVDMAEPAQKVTASIDGDEIVMSNGLVSVRINRFGELTACADAKGQSRISGKANVLHLYKDTPRLYDAWDIDCMYDQCPADLSGESSIELIEVSPWRAEARVTRSFGNSEWVQVIRLDAEKTQIDFITHVEWHEQHRLLKAAFPTGIHTDEGINEIQFGFVRRPTHRSRSYDADRFEVCNHHYTALNDEHRGAAVLNESKYGVSMLGDEIALTLLRAPMAPEFHADQGAHDFTYSYYLWDGSLFDSGVVRAGYELNVPVREAAGSAADFSLVSIDAPNVILDTVKAAEDGSGDVILRLYECKHAAATAAVTLNLPFKKAYVCDLLENIQEEVSADGQRLTIPFHGFEVKTIRLQK